MTINSGMVEVSVIIVNYNTDALTLQAVESVLTYGKDVSLEIIVVDNNSDKTTLHSSLSNKAYVSFYRMETNMGFGSANNFGYSKSKGDFVFLLNSDAYLIDETTISTFIHYLKEHPEVACVGGNLINENGHPNISYGNFLSVERVLYDYGLKKVSKDYFKKYLATSKVCDFEQPQDVDYLTAAALMIKREIIEAYGFFDSRYFMYFEDMDLAYRLKKHGYLSVLLPSVKVVHLGGKSALKNEQKKVVLDKHILYSKYLFLQHVASKPNAYVLFILGKVLPLIKRAKRKLSLN